MRPTVCFLVGSADISGGTYVIFQHAIFLSRNGYQVTLGVLEPFTRSTYSWHPEAHILNFLPVDEARKHFFDLVVATWWKTALELPAFYGQRKAYFVQSIESRFYPQCEGPLRELVESTYNLPVSFVTEASWIKKWLMETKNQNAALVLNGIRKDFYSPYGLAVSPRVRGRPKVLVEGPLGVSFKNTALSIRLGYKARAPELWLVSSSTLLGKIPYCTQQFSRVSTRQMGEIYRSCDVLIKLSTVEGMFGPPLEMFHCGGTAITFDVSGSDEYMKDGINGLVVKTGDTEAVCRSLDRLVSDPVVLETLKEGALQTALNWPDWDLSSRQFLYWVEKTLENDCPNNSIDEQLSLLASTAWNKYVKDETLRLKQLRKFEIPHRLRQSARFVPGYFRRELKYARQVFEVVTASTAQ